MATRSLLSLAAILSLPLLAPARQPASPPAEHPDEYHDLKLGIGQPGLTLRTSTGYYNQP